MYWGNSDDAIEILFRGKPYIARLNAVVMTCTSVVYYDGNYLCGVGVLLENGSLTFNRTALRWPHDLIAAWRGAEMLTHVSNAPVTEKTLFIAYLAGVREPNLNEREACIRLFIRDVGLEKYKQGLQKPVPERIIQAILTNQRKKSPPALNTISDEVRAGTINWRSEFDDFGIMHPREVEAEQRKQEKIIAQFEQVLTSYAYTRGIPRQSCGMRYVERALLDLVGKGVSETLFSRELVALAGVIGELSCRQFALHTSPYSHHIWNDHTIGGAIQYAIDWLSSEDPSVAQKRDEMSWFMLSQLEKHSPIPISV